ncbi:MAG: hypothetical protein KDD47_20040, partial [Acidobacteria bacterium]|nr:hypothetical protein [Acidobacteriota bacterium]
GEAATEFESVTVAHPDFAAGFYMLGRSWQEQGRHSEALAGLRRAGELDTSNAQYAFYLAKS